MYNNKFDKERIDYISEYFQESNVEPLTVTSEIIRNDLYRIRATPHKDRLSPLPPACLHLFRHLAQIFLEGRQPVCVKFVQSDEKSDCAIGRQSLCGVTLDLKTVKLFYNFFTKQKVKIAKHKLE